MRVLPLALLASACIDVAPAPRPLEAGRGVRIDDGKVSLDPASALPDCAVGKILKRGENGWNCDDPAGASIDTAKTPVLTGCRAGQLIAWNGDGWACADAPASGGVDPAKTPVLSGCAKDAVVTWDGTKWACTAPAGGPGVDPAKTPVLSGCAKDAVVTWDGTKWACAVPATNGLDTRVAALETRIEGLATSSYETRTATRAATPPNECVSIVHNFHTDAVGYAGWISDGAGGWVSAQQVRGIPVDLARKRTATSSESGSYPQYAVDGDDPGSWWDATWASGVWWQVDLGASKPLGTVRVLPQPPDRGPASGEVAWNVFVSDTTTFPATPIATGTCTWDGSCRAWQHHDLPAGTRGRYVRFVPTAVSAGAVSVSLAGFEVYAPRDPIVHPSADELRLCNVTDAPRDLILRVWK